jgi:hypothetical protein
MLDADIGELVLNPKATRGALCFRLAEDISMDRSRKRKKSPRSEKLHRFGIRRTQASTHLCRYYELVRSA